MIDNILANRLNEDDLSGILYTDLSDRLPIIALERDTILKQKFEKFKRRQITPENITLMIDDLSQENWHTWALINEIITKKSQQASYLMLLSVHNNEEIKDPVEIANKLNEFFCKCRTKSRY